MDKLKSVIDVLKILDRSNCKECGSPTCVAFAAEIISGQKQLSECPRLGSEILSRYESGIEKRDTAEEREMQSLGRLKKQIAGIDLEAAARRLDAEFADGRLTLRCLGKRFSVDAEGNFLTDIHVNTWIAGPVVNYIVHGAGVEPSGDWVPFRDLAGGKSWRLFFEKQCEEKLKKVADANPAFFDDLIRVFSGKQVENHYESDVSLVLRPLSKFPILICYWKSDGPLPSDMNVFFDSTAEENLQIELIYALATGLAVMFDKISKSHAG